jgi:hypothetical protein
LTAQGLMTPVIPYCTMTTTNPTYQFPLHLMGIELRALCLLRKCSTT